MTSGVRGLRSLLSKVEKSLIEQLKIPQIQILQTEYMRWRDLELEAQDTLKDLIEKHKAGTSGDSQKKIVK